MVPPRLTRFATGDGVPAQADGFNWSFDQPGHTYTPLCCRDHALVFSPTGGLIQQGAYFGRVGRLRGVGTWASKQSRTQRRVRPASHLQRRSSYSRTSSGPGLFQSRCYASEAGAGECDCESGQEPGVLARGGRGGVADASILLDHGGPLGAAGPGRAKLSIWVLHQVIGSFRHHGCVIQRGMLQLSLGAGIYIHTIATP